LLPVPLLELHPVPLLALHPVPLLALPLVQSLTLQLTLIPKGDGGMLVPALWKLKPVWLDFAPVCPSLCFSALWSGLAPLKLLQVVLVFEKVPVGMPGPKMFVLEYDAPAGMPGPKVPVLEYVPAGMPGPKVWKEKLG
jgi:hypothetical protein